MIRSRARARCCPISAWLNLGFDPSGVAVEASGTLVVIDQNAGAGTRGALFRVDPITGARTLLSDFGVGPNLGFDPFGVAVEANGTLVVVDFSAGIGLLGALFRVDPVTGARTLLSDFGVGPNQGAEPIGLAVEANGTLVVADFNAGTGGRGALFRVDPVTGARTLLSDFGVGANQGVDPVGVAVEASGTLVVVDATAGGGRGALFRIVAGGPSRLTIAACTLDLRQDWVPAFTKLAVRRLERRRGQVHRRLRVRRQLARDAVRRRPRRGRRQNFPLEVLGTFGARYPRAGRQEHAVRASGQHRRSGHRDAGGGRASRSGRRTCAGELVGTTLTAPASSPGKIMWDPEGAVPEGGIR